MNSQLQLLLSVVTVLGSGGMAAFITAWSRRGVDAATGRKTDIEAAVLLLGEHRKDNQALREEIGVLKSEVESNRRESVELRQWAIEIDAWARAAVSVIEDNNGRIDPPPPPPDRRRHPRPLIKAPVHEEGNLLPTTQEGKFL